eukprot:132660_1
MIWIQIRNKRNEAVRIDKEEANENRVEELSKKHADRQYHAVLQELLGNNKKKQITHLEVDDKIITKGHEMTERFNTHFNSMNDDSNCEYTEEMKQIDIMTSATKKYTKEKAHGGEKEI